MALRYNAKEKEIIDALPFDSTKTYNQYDYCRYENDLYRCIVTIEEAEDFDEDHWELVDFRNLHPGEFQYDEEGNHTGEIFNVIEGEGSIITPVEGVAAEGAQVSIYELGDYNDTLYMYQSMFGISPLNTFTKQYVLSFLFITNNAPTLMSEPFIDEIELNGKKGAIKKGEIYAIDGTSVGLDNTVYIVSVQVEEEGSPEDVEDAVYEWMKQFVEDPDVDPIESFKVNVSKEVVNNTAKGISSHAEGIGTIASSEAQHVEGKFNVEDKDGKYIHITGNGTNKDLRSNAFTIDNVGNGEFKGDIESHYEEYGDGNNRTFKASLSAGCKEYSEVYSGGGYIEPQGEVFNIGRLAPNDSTVLPSLISIGYTYNPKTRCYEKYIKEDEITELTFVDLAETDTIKLHDVVLNEAILPPFPNTKLISKAVPGWNDDTYIIGMLEEFDIDNERFALIKDIKGSHILFSGVDVTCIRNGEPRIFTNDEVLVDLYNNNAICKAGDASTGVIKSIELNEDSRIVLYYGSIHDNKALGEYSHAEGVACMTIGDYSHIEGESNVNIGENSHVEGSYNISYGRSIHIEGNSNTVSNTKIPTSPVYECHVEGSANTVEGDYSHIEGQSNSVYGDKCHVEGDSNTIEGKRNGIYYNPSKCSHVEGEGHLLIADNSHVEGSSNKMYGDKSHAEGSNVQVGWDLSDYPEYDKTQTYNLNNLCAYVDSIWRCKEDNVTGNWDSNKWQQITQGNNAHAEGLSTKAYAKGSHVEGSDCKAFDEYSHAEGYDSRTYAKFSHAEGQSQAYGKFSHSEGEGTKANGDNSHAEGYHTYANGKRSHAEGDSTYAYGEGSHSEGYNTKASGDNSHAEGNYSIAYNDSTHAEGDHTVVGVGEYDITKTYAKDDVVKNGETGTRENFYKCKEDNVTGEWDASKWEQITRYSNVKNTPEGAHVQGTYNVKDTQGKYAHIVGNGASENYRSNAHTLDWQGNAWYAGDVSVDYHQRLMPSGGGDPYDVDYTLSLKKSANLVVGTDLNDIAHGSFWVNAGCLNTPIENVQGTMTEIWHDGGNSTQLFTVVGTDHTDSDDGKMFIRTTINGVCGSWRELGAGGGSSKIKVTGVVDSTNKKKVTFTNNAIGDDKVYAPTFCCSNMAREIVSKSVDGNTITVIYDYEIKSTETCKLLLEEI